MKKKTGISICILAVLALMLAGCGKDDDGNVDMQPVYDISVQAEAYTKPLFEAMLSEKGITDYEITLTSGGFITDDPLVFIAGYRYTYDGKEAVYGYKLSLNDDGKTFTVLEESVEAGEFVVGHTKKDETDVVS